MIVNVALRFTGTATEPLAGVRPVGVTIRSWSHPSLGKLELSYINTKAAPFRLAVGILALGGDDLVLVPGFQYLSEDHGADASTG